MAKIYNEIVIDMNPESSTFEETLYEDSFEYSGDMMLAQYTANQFREGDVAWVHEGGDSIYYREHKVVNGRWEDQKNLNNAPPEDEKFDELPGNEFVAGYNPATLGERDVGMGDVTAEDMLGKSEDEMLKWIIDTRYGGQLPIGISETDIVTQIRTKLPQKGGMKTTDWYGIQDTASKVSDKGASVYGGMGTGMRGQIAGQKQIGKDIYALEEGKGEEWTSKFRTFLSSLPSATGTSSL